MLVHLLTVPEAYKPALDFAKQQLQAKTVHKAMSIASYQFARLLLWGFRIEVEVDAPNSELGSSADPPSYSWTVETTANETLNIGEHQGTPRAKEWFSQHFLQDSNEALGLQVVTGAPLPELKANQRSTAGKGDLVIGKKSDFAIPGVVPYEHAHGLVELKTDEYPLKPGQNVLELASLATISRFGRNVALLATDCGEKWELIFFKDLRTINRRPYAHGRKCWEDFKELLDAVETRVLEEHASKKLKRAVRPNFEAVAEEEIGNEHNEQDLDGFDVGQNDSKLNAVERQAMLNNLSNQLGAMYGERPVVPEWAHAATTCPDYYM